MIAPCGLICDECSVYKAAMDPQKAEELAIKWREYGHSDAKPEWFKCRGCHGDDALVWGSDCEIRNCCIKINKLDNCSKCHEFPCGRIIEFENDGIEHHKSAVEYLRKIREEIV